MPAPFNATPKSPRPHVPSPVREATFWQHVQHWDQSHKDSRCPPFQSPVEVTSRSYQGTLLVCRWALLPTSLHRCSPRKQGSREWEMQQVPSTEVWHPFQRERGGLSLRPLSMWQWLLRWSQHKPQSQTRGQKLKWARAAGCDSNPSAAFLCPESKRTLLFFFKDGKIRIFFILMLLT